MYFIIESGDLRVSYLNSFVISVKKSPDIRQKDNALGKDNIISQKIQTVPMIKSTLFESYQTPKITPVAVTDLTSEQLQQMKLKPGDLVMDPCGRVYQVQEVGKLAEPSIAAAPEVAVEAKRGVAVDSASTYDDSIFYSIADQRFDLASPTPYAVPFGLNVGIDDLTGFGFPVSFGLPGGAERGIGSAVSFPEGSESFEAPLEGGEGGAGGVAFPGVSGDGDGGPGDGGENIAPTLAPIEFNIKEGASPGIPDIEDLDNLVTDPNVGDTHRFKINGVFVNIGDKILSTDAFAEIEVLEGNVVRVSLTSLGESFYNHLPEEEIASRGLQWTIIAVDSGGLESNAIQPGYQVEGTNDFPQDGDELCPDGDGLNISKNENGMLFLLANASDPDDMDELSISAVGLPVITVDAGTFDPDDISVEVFNDEDSNTFAFRFSSASGESFLTIIAMGVDAGKTTLTHEDGGAFDLLGDDDRIKISIENYEVSDLGGKINLSTAEICISGFNVCPVVEPPPDNEVTEPMEGSGMGDFAPLISGNLLANTTDEDYEIADLVITTVNGQIDDDDDGFIVVISALGTLTVRAVSIENTTMPANLAGYYEFDLNEAAANHLAAGVLEELLFTFKVTDNGPDPETGELCSEESTLMITLHGANDSPTITTILIEKEITEVIDDNEPEDRQETSPVTGNLFTESGADDPDDGDELFLNDQTDTIILAEKVFQGQFGTLTVQVDGSYVYVLNNELNAVNSLAPGEDLTDIFIFSVTDRNDSSGKTSPAFTLEITIQGINDSPVISTQIFGDTISNTDTTPHMGNICEDGSAFDPEGDPIEIFSVNGISDGEDGDLDTIVGTITIEIPEGMIVVNVETCAYTFTLNTEDDEVAGLDPNEELFLTFSIVITDGMATASTDLIITIVGSEVIEEDCNVFPFSSQLKNEYQQLFGTALIIHNDLYMGTVSGVDPTPTIAQRYSDIATIERLATLFPNNYFGQFPDLEDPLHPSEGPSVNQIIEPIDLGNKNNANGGAGNDYLDGGLEDNRLGGGEWQRYHLWGTFRKQRE